jgi:cellulose synthase/poly-beta-1,6-N-acetylglucosamine synthase-like glycosyltransferase
MGDFLLILLDGLALILFSVLAVFAARRLLFTLSLFRPQPPRPAPQTLPDVLLLIPARDESATLPGLFEALDRLDYDRDKLQVVLISDGSTDDTAQVMVAACASRAHWQTLILPANVGKSQALNLALAECDFGEIAYIFDVDHRPRPDCLRRAAAAFADPNVAGVSGRTIPANALASPAAFYAAVELMVHQLITMRGKDVFALGPALLGSNNGYRRRALAAVGGFRPGVFLEDSDLTLSLYRAGYVTRFAPEAISYHQAPQTVRGYVRQHLRWGRGFNDVARAHLGSLIADRTLPWLMRLELTIFALGYLDRLALLAAIVFTVLGIARPWMAIGILLSLALPFVQIIAAFIFDRAPPGMWIRLPLTPVFFVLDVATTVWAMAATLLDLPRVWYKTQRV